MRRNESKGKILHEPLKLRHRPRVVAGINAPPGKHGAKVCVLIDRLLFGKVGLCVTIGLISVDSCSIYGGAVVTFLVKETCSKMFDYE